MKTFLAILVCKLVRAVGKLVGKGSSLPGKFALKLCPDILRRVKLPKTIIAVTGSNGKTSTVEMIAAILRSAGKTVVYNKEGSNQIEGVTTLVLTHADFSGQVQADVLLIESDERYAAHSFRFFQCFLGLFHRIGQGILGLIQLCRCGGLQILIGCPL